jgi:hypothetical protein
MFPKRLSALLLLGLAACSEPKRVEPTAEESAPPPSEPLVLAKKEVPLPDPVDPPKPGTTPPKAEPEPAPPPAKPTEGSTVFAVARISMVTEDGVFSVPQGARLKVVSVGDKKLKVNDGKHTFEVAEEQVTLATAASMPAPSVDPSVAQARMEAYRAEQERLAIAKERAVTAQAQAAAAQERAARNQRISELQAKIDQFTREQSVIEAGLQRGREEENQASWARYNRRTYTKTISSQQMTAWATRLPVVQSEIRRLEYAVQSLRNQP